MIGGKSWLELAVVSAVALGFLTLMIVIQALQNGRSRSEIIRGVALVWGAVALTLTLAGLLQGHWGGAVIDVQVPPRPQVLTRSLSGTQAAVLGAMLVAIAGLYITAILAVRRLTQPADQLSVTPGDGGGSESRGESE